MITHNIQPSPVLPLALCLLFSVVSTSRAQSDVVHEGFTLGTTVSLQLDQTAITRNSWAIRYGDTMPGTVSVSKKGTTGTNEIKLYGRRDGDLYTQETYWSMPTQTISLNQDQLSSRIILPFGPVCTATQLQVIQKYKYTASIQAGTQTASDSELLQVTFDNDGLDAVLNETQD